MATNDIEDIYDYYKAINPKLAEAFMKDLGVAISQIQIMPQACQKRIGDIRSVFLKRFRYGVYFKIYINRISIIAVLHTSRNPQIWKKRK
jgi:plasmid stabilization system protein ParE